MGKYLDLLQNFSPEPYNYTFNLSTDLMSQATETTNNTTNGYIGLGIITTFFFLIYNTLSKTENLFELSKFQALTSTIGICMTCTLFLVFLEIMTTPQHFIWVSVVTLIIFIIGIIRTN